MVRVRPDPLDGTEVSRIRTFPHDPVAAAEVEAVQTLTVGLVALETNERQGSHIHLLAATIGLRDGQRGIEIRRFHRLEEIAVLVALARRVNVDALRPNTGETGQVFEELRGVDTHRIQRAAHYYRNADGAVFARDVTQRRRYEERLQYLAEHDHLTGLLNRRRFEDELSRELSAATAGTIARSSAACQPPRPCACCGRSASVVPSSGICAAMPKITYIEHGGREHRVEVAVGLSVMRGAVDNNIPGIDADCGGECACATCHVYVEDGWLAATGLPVPGSQEASMLSFAAVTQADSRLSCQIPVTDALDGLVVRMPEGQH